MSEWWTYTLSDFLLFSARTYYRLFEIYNAAIWPAQLAALAMGLAILVLSLRGGRDGDRRGRWMAGLLAVCWLWVAIAFHANRYATINWAAVYFAWAFGLEAALLAWAGVVRGRLQFDGPEDVPKRVGLAILLLGLLVWPCLAPLLGRGWKTAEVFGAAPDPTAIATLGVLLLARGRWRGWLMVIPSIWCAISGFTLLALKSPVAWAPPLAALTAVAVATAQRRARRRNV